MGIKVELNDNRIIDLHRIAQEEGPLSDNFKSKLSEYMKDESFRQVLSELMDEVENSEGYNCQKEVILSTILSGDYSILELPHIIAAKSIMASSDEKNILKNTIIANIIVTLGTKFLKVFI